MESKEILRVENLKTYFEVSGGLLAKKQYVKAVDDVSLSINEGETFGLVGESGCGKSTLGRTIVKLYEPTAGKIFFDGEDITAIKNKDKLHNFHKDCQLIFQDPYASLDPRMTVGEIIKEPMEIHGMYSSNEEREKVCVELLETVGLKPDHIRRYPHEFSGGQRQRISIARTLALKPKFIVCDEPISALDVSIQAQIINILKDIQKNLNIAYLFIGHDLAMIETIADRIGVMYLGHLVEVGTAEEVYHHPVHPYTQALLSAVPVPDPVVGKNKQRMILEGETPSPIDPPSGCPFRTRCLYATEVCAKEMPVMREFGGHMAACARLGELEEKHL
ncbi:MAG: dipeptide ABC transporter ATP-binding protein [Firmicutes bacterium]|nr:dipeptide ABC transporter ATP-binding protein [Bacillota bacterium]